MKAFDKAYEEKILLDLDDPKLADDPYAFVMYAYPWGEPGGPLERFKGPRKWQTKVLLQVKAHIAEQKAKLRRGEPPTKFQLARASGRGIGKSALVGWLTHWMLSTRIGSTVVVTANNEHQLKNRTFAEIQLWVGMSVNGHWFEMTTMDIRPAKWFAEMVKRDMKRDTRYYYASGQLWSEDDPAGFAGQHSQIGMMVIFDEASGIPSSIWPVAAGYLSDLTADRYWFAFSNPRSTEGGFYDAFHNPRSPWLKENVDARTVEDSDQAHYAQQIDEFGEDSYTARVEVMGLFPRQGEKQFIPYELAMAAVNREVAPDHGAPLIMGVDVARFGDDLNVVRFRQGPLADEIPPTKWQGVDLDVTANRVGLLIEEHNPDAICIDSGMGSTVVILLKQRGYRGIHEVAFGSVGRDPWANLGTQMYADMREWLKSGAIDDDARLIKDLTGREYKPHGKAQDQIILEQKDLFKARNIGRSPDDGDALALTFAVKVARRDLTHYRDANKPRMAQGLDYSLFGE